MERSEILAKMEAVVKRTDRFSEFFDSEIYKEWIEILAKKIDGYRIMLNKVPRVGEEKTMQQVSMSGDRKEVTLVPYRVTAEERTFAINELNAKISEVQSIIDMPDLMRADANRMRAEMVKLGDKQ